MLNAGSINHLPAIISFRRRLELPARSGTRTSRIPNEIEDRLRDRDHSCDEQGKQNLPLALPARFSRRPPRSEPRSDDAQECVQKGRDGLPLGGFDGLSFLGALFRDVRRELAFRRRDGASKKRDHRIGLRFKRCRLESSLRRRSTGPLRYRLQKWVGHRWRYRVRNVRFQLRGEFGGQQRS